MTGDRIHPRWIIAVRRDKRDLYVNLRRSFDSEARVEVILDRRQADRRGKQVRIETNRRRRQRRRQPTAKALALWVGAGFRLAEAVPGNRHIARPEDEGSGHEAPRPGIEAAAEIRHGEQPSQIPVDELAAAEARLVEEATPTNHVESKRAEHESDLRWLAEGLGEADPLTARYDILKGWLDACRDALGSERLTICQSYLALAIRMLESSAHRRSE